MALALSRLCCRHRRRNLLFVLALVGLAGIWTQLGSLSDVGDHTGGGNLSPPAPKLVYSNNRYSPGIGRALSGENAAGGLLNGTTAPSPDVPDWRPCYLNPAEQRAASSGERNYIPKTCQVNWDSAVLWSFPGSGNTWMRSLLEMSTGYYTGSVYNDKDLKPIFPGEWTCDQTTLVNKAHPTFTPYELVRNWARQVPLKQDEIPWHGEEMSILKSPDGSINHFLRKCQAWHPKRAIIIDRDPYSAIWAEYQRLLVGEHTSIVDEDLFDANDFGYEAVRLAQSYTASWSSYRRWQKEVPGIRGSHVFVLPFQDLVANCTNSLKKLFQWLKPPRHPKGSAWQVDRACGYQEGRIKRDKSRAVSLTRVWPKELVCRVWSVVGNICSQNGHQPGPLIPEVGRDCPSRDELVLALAQMVATDAADGKTVVLTTTSAGYVHVTINWMLRVRLHNKQVKPLIAALDWDSHDTLNRLGAAVFPMIPRYSPVGRHRREGFRRFDGVWIERSGVIMTLLDNGFNVLNCDSDAVWTRDALSELSSLMRLNGEDIHAIASAGTFPMDLRDALGGMTAVMGFILLRTSPQMRAFFHAVEEQTIVDGDDQVAFNTQLVSRGAKPGKMALNSTKWKWLHGSHLLHVPAASKQGASVAGPMKIVILEDTVVLRNCSKRAPADALAVHCFASKDGKAKGNKLERMGLWSCPTHWEAKMLSNAWPGEGASQVASLPAILSNSTRPKLAELERRFKQLEDMVRFDATVIVYIEGATAGSNLYDFEALVITLAHGVQKNGLKVELIAVLWDATEDERMTFASTATRVSNAALTLRLILVPEALRTLILRRHVGRKGVAGAAAYNMASRLASSLRMVVVSLGTFFADGFFAALSSSKQSMEPNVQVLSSCIVDIGSRANATLRVMKNASELEQKFCSGRQYRSGGLSMPVSVWAAVEGMPESPLLSQDADLHFDQRLRSTGYRPTWMACGGACIFSLRSTWKPQWRVGPISSSEKAVGNQPRLEMQLSSDEVQQELALLQKSGAKAGLDAGCRWGLVGHTVSEHRIEASTESLTLRELRVPFLDMGGDKRGISTIMTCSSFSTQQKAWNLWRSRAVYAKPLLVVRAEGGLGNRLRAFLSGWALAESLNYFYAAIWEPDVECGATFYDLFDGLEEILVLDFQPWGIEGPGKEWVEYDGIELGRRISLSKNESQNRNIFVRTQNFILSDLKRYSLEAYAKKFAMLYPRSKDLKHIYRSILERLDMHHIIGMHVRMTGNESAMVFGTDRQLQDVMDVSLQNLNWHEKAAQEALLDRRALCNWSNFIEPSWKLLKEKRERQPLSGGAVWRLMVACDEASCLQGVRDSIGSDKVVSVRDFLPHTYFEQCSIDSRSVLCQRLALIEILVMMQADFLLLSQPSSFSDAMRFGKLGRILVKEEKEAKARDRKPITAEEVWRPRFGIICGKNMDFRRIFDPTSALHLLNNKPGLAPPAAKPMAKSPKGGRPKKAAELPV